MQVLTIVLLAATIAGVSANIHCFQCTSNENKVCEQNDENDLKAFNKVCGPNNNQKAIGCRKISQNVEGEEIIVRECAYSGENVDGLKKTGNHAIQLYYYQCTNEKDNAPCNFVQSTFSMVTILSVVAFYLFQ
ncbi:unnamed protein product [Caenorhabditis angaria]|uniref:Protein sleepless n=1 Tax=Caenorhabditis angaria TaxID=860376 RepID=A0A9P1N9S6_9PELO|nr:unnamed protein product [Caenorhabditis angaria]